MDKHWQIKNDTFNFKPIRDAEIDKQMISIRVAVATAVHIFKEQIQGNIKTYFSYMEKSGHDRFWGNEDISVTFTRDRDDYFIMVDGDDGTYFVISFTKPDDWSLPIDLEPFAAYGETQNIISLAKLFSEEWPNCHKLVWSKEKEQWI